ncbi:hypothetical protein [Hymenobacter sp. IS2118]|uniref:hypothetical protein n=1 Tax=Hymenobacter sp. IS2118 TaxID=1505605 RepID=UPI00137778C5|nr:hypothetical protein [Hymenobacter sp. IS2118]
MKRIKNEELKIKNLTISFLIFNSSFLIPSKTVHQARKRATRHRSGPWRALPTKNGRAG